MTHINERAVEVAEMLLDVTDDLRADVEALKQQKPFLTRFLEQEAWCEGILNLRARHAGVSGPDDADDNKANPHARAA